jgi:hypothetical protein
MENHLRVLEIFYTYLHGTQNWIYRLISNLPNTDVVIAAKSFLKCNFYASNFEYLVPIENDRPEPKCIYASSFQCPCL